MNVNGAGCLDGSYRIVSGHVAVFYNAGKVAVIGKIIPCFSVCIDVHVMFTISPHMVVIISGVIVVGFSGFPSAITACRYDG